MTETSAKGRKRKIGLIAATQRVAKISKNFTAELGNKLVGVAYQDQDRARAGKELEFTNQEQIQSLRRLTAGQFYAFGPALGHEVKLAQIGMPEIKPTGTGRNLMKAPAPTSKVKAILDKFKDLPKEAQEEAKTIDALKKNNADLAAQVRALERRPVPLAPAAQLSEVDLKRLRAEYHKKYDDLTKEFDRRRIAEIKKAMVEMQEGFILASNQVYKKYSGKTETPEIKISTHPPASQIAPKTVAAIEEMVKVIADGDKSKFQKMDYVIVNFLGIFPKQTYTVAQAAYGAGYSQGGGFSNALSRLSSAGVIKRDKGRVALLDYGFTYNPSAKSPIEAWLANLQKMDREIWKYLMLRQGESFSVQELAERTNYSPGGGFSNALSRLSSCEMIIREKGFVKLNQNILELL
jgi:predicted transcriptional regulator